jgi:hypothetical protein
MKPATTVTTTTDARRPNRVLMMLAAAWMILSLAVGGAISAEATAQVPAPATAINGSTQQP